MRQSVLSEMSTGNLSYGIAASFHDLTGGESKAFRDCAGLTERIRAMTCVTCSNESAVRLYAQPTFQRRVLCQDVVGCYCNRLSCHCGHDGSAGGSSNRCRSKDESY